MADHDSEVLHQPQQHRFVAQADGTEAFLEYRMLAPDVIDFVHTYTPEPLRGRGLAGKLVSAGVNFARAQDWRVIGTCTYVAAWLEKHPPVA